jgi:hypothetical protein
MTSPQLCTLSTQTRHYAPQLLNASCVAAIPQHLMQSRGAKARMRFQRLTHERKIGIENRGAQLLGAMKTLHLDGPPHRLGMNSQRLCDRAHLPVLGVKVAADLNPHFWIDHLSSPARRCARKRIDEAASPATDRTTQSITGPFVWPDTQRHERRRRVRFSTLRWWRRNPRLGTLIRHAARTSAATIGTLTITMIQSFLGALLMPPVGRAMLLAPRMVSALCAAITLAAIAARANPEQRPAAGVAAKPQQQNNFPMNPHPHA